MISCFSCYICNYEAAKLHLTLLISIDKYLKRNYYDKMYLKCTSYAYSSGHLVLSHLGLAFVLMLRPFFSELVMSTDLLSLEHPSVLLFSFLNTVRN